MQKQHRSVRSIICLSVMGQLVAGAAALAQGVDSGALALSPPVERVATTIGVGDQTPDPGDIGGASAVSLAGGSLPFGFGMSQILLPWPESGTNLLGFVELDVAIDSTLMASATSVTVRTPASYVVSLANEEEEQGRPRGAGWYYEPEDDFESGAAMLTLFPTGVYTVTVFDSDGDAHPKEYDCSLPFPTDQPQLIAPWHGAILSTSDREVFWEPVQDTGSVSMVYLSLEQWGDPDVNVEGQLLPATNTSTLWQTNPLPQGELTVICGFANGIDLPDADTIQVDDAFAGSFFVRLRAHAVVYTASDTPPPGRVVPLAPLGSDIGERLPEFRWQQTGEAAQWYNLAVRKDGAPHLNRWVQGQTFWDCESALSFGSYSWWVHPWNAIGYGAWSVPGSFTIERALPGAVTPQSPTGGVAVASRTPTLEWTQAGNGATWWHVVVRRDGAPYLDKWVQAPELPLTTPLVPGSYRWWVQPWHPDGYGTWSSGAAFIVAAAIPAKPIPQAPLGFQAHTSLTYQWGHDSHTAWYQFMTVRAGTPFHSRWYLAADIAAGGIAEVSVPGHPWGDYQWYVRGWAPDGMGLWSDPGQFACGKATPVAGTVSQLTWDDACTTTAAWYQVWINDVTGTPAVKERAWWFERATTTDAGSGNRLIQLIPPLSAGDYEWSIRAWSSANGMGPWSETHAFSGP